MPRPPWEDGAPGWDRGGTRGEHDHGAHSHGGHEHEEHGIRSGRGRGPWGPEGFGSRSADGKERGIPPWAAHARFSGPARLRLLEALAAASDPLTVSEVAEAIGVDQPRASRLVQQSVELGVVRREADPDDARRTRIVLTDEGAGLIRGFRGERRGAVASALDGFTADEQAELARLLTKLAEAWPRA
ncbi:MAG: MarR family winged helix-turn-helix transcriptional regulator [Actinobacteria bacterium]|nr:MarR family winged helix-turn-helix transcriptional regulator [Actinomycetota bacterium]